MVNRTVLVQRVPYPFVAAAEPASIPAKLCLVTRILIALACFLTAVGNVQALPVADQASERERALVERVEQLERRLTELEARMTGQGVRDALARRRPNWRGIRLQRLRLL